MPGRPSKRWQCTKCGRERPLKSRSSARAFPACRRPGCSAGGRVTVYESERRAGGHTNTVTVKCRGREIPVDTGFIVYNEATYPNLTALFDHLDVPTQASDMSFAVSLDGGALEYSGGNMSGLFAQKRNLFRPRFWSMLRDLHRFYREAPRDRASDRSAHDAGRISRCQRLRRGVPRGSSAADGGRDLVGAACEIAAIIRPRPSSASTTITACCRLAQPAEMAHGDRRQPGLCRAI